MKNVVQIYKQPQLFSLEEASVCLPVISRITAAASKKVQAHIDDLDALGPENEEIVNAIEDRINAIIQSWQQKIEKLGALPKGLWVVDFDCGNGYYCWKYPEPEIMYWHTYTEGFAKRTRIRSIEIDDLVLEEKTR